MFVKESDAICLLPGGFGTLDEGLEVLTLLQTGKPTWCRWCSSTNRAAITGRRWSHSSKSNC